MHISAYANAYEYISAHTYTTRSYCCELVGGLRAHFIHTVRGVWGRELVCWPAVLDMKTSPYDVDRVLQVVMGWNIITYHIHTSTHASLNNENM